MNDRIQQGVNVAFQQLQTLSKNSSPAWSPELSTSWKSYGKIYNVGHNIVTDIFEDTVLIEEKLDGSQFSWGIFNGELKVRSKGVEMDVEAPEKMFNKAVATVKELAPILKDGWTYRAEYFQKPKHNTLAYDRIPEKHLIVFDIATGEETYLSYEEKKKECERLGLEVVPILYEGTVNNPQFIKDLLNRVSILGGQKIEGVVVKNYQKFGPDKKTLMAKHVSEEFKEVHKGDWKDRHQTQGDIIDKLISSLRTEARWNKALQHLMEKGILTNSPKDIGPLIQEVMKDTLEEEKHYIQEQLYLWGKSRIERGITGGLPQWYKEKLLSSQFTTNE